MTNILIVAVGAAFVAGWWVAGWIANREFAPARCVDADDHAARLAIAERDRQDHSPTPEGFGFRRVIDLTDGGES